MFSGGSSPAGSQARSFSGTPFAGAYLCLQAVAIAAWWTSLLVWPAARRYFVPYGAGEADLMAFLAPDLLVAAPLSLAGGIAFLRRSSWTAPLAWAAAGAVGYAWLYCVAWSRLRGGAWINVALMAPAAVLSAIAALDASVGTIPIFRRATSVAPARHVLATAGQVAVFWGVFLGVLPAAVHAVESQLGVPRFLFPTQTPIAAAIFAACSGLGLWSGFTMAARGRGTPLPLASTSRLVISGPYAHLRNPMVVAGLGQGSAVAIGLGSWMVLAYVLLGATIWQILVRPAEERDLVEYFGEDYLHYRAHVRCWVPCVTRYEPARPVHVRRVP